MLAPLYASTLYAASDFVTAKKLGKAHAPGCSGGFPDISGKCWKCPNGYRHNSILLAPTDGKVCKKTGGRSLATGVDKGKGSGLKASKFVEVASIAFE